jgi:hypothetical protein
MVGFLTKGHRPPGDGQTAIRSNPAIDYDFGDGCGIDEQSRVLKIHDDVPVGKNKISGASERRPIGIGGGGTGDGFGGDRQDEATGATMVEEDVLQA